MIRLFDPFPAKARRAAIDLFACFLRNVVPTKEQAEQRWFGGTTQERSEVAVASLILARGLALRLRSEDGMTLINRLFLEASSAAMPDDPDVPLAAALVAGFLQTSTSLPEDYIAESLHNIGTDAFNDAIDAANAAGRGTEAILRALELLASLMPEAGGDAGVALLCDVAAELWRDE